jgi:hypothetical protein
MISCYLVTDANGVATVVETQGETRAIWLWKQENRGEIVKIEMISSHGALREL